MLHLTHILLVTLCTGFCAPKPPQSPLSLDLDGDGAITIADLTHWGTLGLARDMSGDLNNDDTVDVEDRDLLATYLLGGDDVVSRWREPLRLRRLAALFHLADVYRGVEYGGRQHLI